MVKKRDRSPLLSEGMLAQIRNITVSGDNATAADDATGAVSDAVEDDTGDATGTKEPGSDTTGQAEPPSPTPSKQPENPENSAAAQNPYRVNRRPPGNLVPIPEPFVFDLGDNSKGATATANFRLPLELSETIEEHCHTLKIKPSEWYRNAAKYLLAVEQELLKNS